MTNFPDLFAALAAPFPKGEVKTRPQGNRQLPYVTARTIMNRLDEVLGPENWTDAYATFERCVVCTLTIRLPDGREVSKSDAGGHAGMQDAGDDAKSAHSDAFKRAAAKWGVGRFLYGDGIPHYEQPAPAQAVEPSRTERPAPAEATPESAPRSGKALFGWAKEIDVRHDVALVKYLMSWGKLQEFPLRMVDWDEQMVGRAYQESIRRLKAMALVSSQDSPQSPEPDASSGDFRLEGEPVVYGKQHPDLATVDKIEESLRKLASKRGQDYETILHEVCEAARAEGFLVKVPEEPTATASLHAAGLVASRVQPQGWLNVTVNTLFPKAEAMA